MITPEAIAAAKAAEKKWDVPASVTLAQFGLESSWGVHMPPGSQNPFGIKAGATQPCVVCKTWEHINGKDIRVDAKFRKFASLADAFDVHGQLLATSHYYAGAMAAWKARHVLKEFVTLMAKSYATDPAYPSKIMAIITANNLAQYDKE